ncbi:MAG: immunoglobulin domain-containing protein [Planctomycetota bacterium]
MLIREIRTIVCAAAMTASAAAHAQTFLIDMGPSSNPTASPDADGNQWNSFAPGQFFRLRDTTGATSAGATGVGIGFGATTPVGQGPATGEGLASPDPALLGDLAVQTATEDFVFRSDDGLGALENLRFEFSNLDQSLVYTVRVFASRVAGDTRETEYTVTGGNGSQSASLLTSNNTQDIAIIGGITPTAAGVIALDAVAVQGAFCYANVIELSVGQALDIPVQPVGTITDAGGALSFDAVVTPAAGVTLQWERDGVPLVDDARVSGSTSTTLTIAPASLADVGMYRLVAHGGGSVLASDEVVGVVRASPLGLPDFNADGAVDFLDVLAFLRAFDAVGG